MDAANDAGIEKLRDGRKVEIRALRSEDRTGLLAAIVCAGEKSIFQRCFAFKRGFTENEIDFSVNVDFVNHVASEISGAGLCRRNGGARPDSRRLRARGHQ
jgi:hypothetical protein